MVKHLELKHYSELYYIRIIIYSVYIYVNSLSPFIFHRTSEIRAATFRVIRYILKSPKDLQVFNYLQFPNLVARSLDIQSKNDEERIQALKLVRHYNISKLRIQINLNCL